MTSEIANRRFWRFLLRTLLAAALALGLVVGVNYGVDACHIITSRSMKQMASLVLAGNAVAVPENYNERIYQMALLDGMRSPPETAVVGSSRGMLLGREITGFPDLFNHCIAGACLEDCYAVLGLYRQRFGAYPRRVILEVSPWLLYGLNPEVRWTELWSYRLAAQNLYVRLNRRNPEIRNTEWTAFGSEGKPFYTRENPWFSLSYFQYNAFTIRQKGLAAFRDEDARPSTDPAEAAELPDGTLRYARSSPEERAETLARVRAAAGPVTYEDVQKMTEIDPEKGEALEALVRDLLADGAKVILYLAPFSETQSRLSFDDQLNPAFDLVEDFVHELAGGCGVPVVGSYDAREYGLGDEVFLDNLHLNAEGNAVVWRTDWR